MIVPFTKGPQGQPTQASAQPSETDMLIALATMHGEGKFAALTQKDQPMIEDSNRTARGVNVDREKGIRERDQTREPLDTDKVLRPGQPVYDRTLGVPGGRDVRGI